MEEILARLFFGLVNLPIYFVACFPGAVIFIAVRRVLIDYRIANGLSLSVLNALFFAPVPTGEYGVALMPVIWAFYWSSHFQERVEIVWLVVSALGVLIGSLIYFFILPNKPFEKRRPPSSATSQGQR